MYISTSNTISPGRPFYDFAWFRRKQQLHFVHHRHANSNFAIIDNFWDRLLGTYRSPDAGDARPRQLLWPDKGVTRFQAISVIISRNSIRLVTRTAQNRRHHLIRRLCRLHLLQRFQLAPQFRRVVSLCHCSCQLAECSLFHAGGYRPSSLPMRGAPTRQKNQNLPRPTNK